MESDPSGRRERTLTAEETTGESKPGTDLASFVWKPGHEAPDGLSHGELVAGFRSYLLRERAAHTWLQRTLPPESQEPFSAEAAISRKLAFETTSPDRERQEFYLPLRFAWDALVYDRLEAGSGAEGLAGSTLNHVYHHNRAHGTPEPDRIRLPDPYHVRILDALAEAAQVPHTQGQTAIQIPEHAQHHTDWLLSAEYARRFRAARQRQP